MEEALLKTFSSYIQSVDNWRNYEGRRANIRGNGFLGQPYQLDNNEFTVGLQKWQRSWKLNKAPEIHQVGLLERV